MAALYNEIDPIAAHVLRALISEGVIAPGVVDTRSITELTPDDVKDFTQVHFFAGGGLWSVAARLAGWPDDRPIWTGSCPCQPFSAAGKGGGVNDPRHLWPDFFRLIRACRPPVVMGEQVAGAPGYGWFDGVRSDLAGEDYASRCVDIPACAVDAPHIRQRLYWIAVGDAESGGWSGAGRPEAHHRAARGGQHRGPDAGGGLNVADSGSQGLAVGSVAEVEQGNVRHEGATALEDDARGGLDVADADRPGPPTHGRDAGEIGGFQAAERGAEDDAALPRREHGATGDSLARRNGSFWSDAEWLACHDGKARRTQPGLRLLVDGLPGRVGLWRIAGNAIVAPLAAEVIGAFLDTERAAA